jgi:hypothetical protein
MPDSDLKSIARRTIRRRRHMVAMLRKSWLMKEVLDES